MYHTKNNLKSNIVLIVGYFLANVLTTCSLFAQTGALVDTSNIQQIKKREFKNTIRFNLTNPVLLSDKSIIFGYERTLGYRQSISINFGHTSLPTMRLEDVNIDNQNLQLSNTSTENGYNASIDYRFYLNKVNKYAAPRGVYLAPYYSYNHFERQNTWLLTTGTFSGEVITDLNFNIHTFGGELGYQFVLWKRVSLDFVLFGPGIANYSLKTELNTTLNADDQSLLFEAINNYLSDRIPGYSLVIEDGDFENTGNVKTTDFGFRYMIHLGFRF